MQSYTAYMFLCSTTHWLTWVGRFVFCLRYLPAKVSSYESLLQVCIMGFNHWMWLFYVFLPLNTVIVSYVVLSWVCVIRFIPRSYHRFIPRVLAIESCFIMDFYHRHCYWYLLVLYIPYHITVQISKPSYPQCTLFNSDSVRIKDNLTSAHRLGLERFWQ